MAQLATIASVLLTFVTAAGASARQQPTFSSGINLLRLDVRVVAGDGTPVAGLLADDFEVLVNGQPCPVRTLQFLDFTAGARASTEDPSPDLSTNISLRPGRLTVIAIDEDSLPQNSRPLMETLAEYVKALGPSDRTAIVALPPPGIWQDFTNDAGDLRNVLLRVSSRTAVDNGRTLAGAGLEGGGQMLSGGSVFVDRGEVADPRQRRRTPLASDERSTGFGESQLPTLHATDLIHALENLARGLAEVDGPKTLLLVSSKVPPGVQLDDYRAFARTAARARLTIYVLKPHVFAASATGNVSQITEPLAPTEGLDTLAATTGGVVLNAVARGVGMMQLIGRETSGSYVLGVEPPPELPGNEPLEVTVHVSRPGLTIRSPKILIPPSSGASTRAQTAGALKTRIIDLLRQPRVATDVPLRVSSYCTAGAEPGTLKTVIVAELQESGRDAGKLTWGFEIRGGDRVAGGAYNLTKAGDPEASRQVLFAATQLAPGSYSLRLATLDTAGRRASVEHSLEVGLFRAGDLHVSDLFVGRVVDGHFQPRITIDPGAEQLAAFLEVYRTGAAPSGPVSVEFTLRGRDGASRSATRAPVRLVQGEPTTVVQAVLPLAHTGPGLYDVVATLLDGTAPIASVERHVVLAGTTGR